MEYQAFEKELSAKKRSADDLIRYIQTRTDQNPNYTILLGAGCSITSGIRSASELCSLWRNEIYTRLAGDDYNENASINNKKEFLQKNHGNWYDSTREYSSLFEQRYDLQRQRRMFVETEVSGKTPSIGYAYLTALVEQNYFNTIFTTNFDDLLNEAFYGYSDQRPIVCAHDSSINSVTITSKRPKIIKLHGDYLFDDLKSTNRETESLEQNMKSKFAEFAKDYGIIILGYSGSDRSIIDVISALLKNEDFFKGGIYWCIRRGSEISEELRKLVWKERVYFVEIDGFDELLADTYSKLNPGQDLPNSLSNTSRRPTDLASKLLNNTTGFNKSHPILTRAKERLEKHTKKTALLDLIAKPDAEGNSKPISNSGLSDDEFYQLAEIQNIINSENHHAAIQRAKSCLSGNIKTNFKARILRLIVQAHDSLDENRQALSVVDELVQLQPKKSGNYLLRASLIKNSSDKLAAIEKACEIDPFSVDAQYAKAHEYLLSMKSIYGSEKLELAHQIESVSERALVLDPSWRNPCWRLLFNIQADLHTGKPKALEEKQKEILSKLKAQNPYSRNLFILRESVLTSESSKDEFDEFFSDLEVAESRLTEDAKHMYAASKIKSLAKSPYSDRIDAQIHTYVEDPELSLQEDAARAVAKVLRTRYAKDEQAIEVLQKTLDSEFDSDVLNDLITTLCNLKQIERASTLFAKWQKYLTYSLRFDLEIMISDAKEDYETTLNLVAARKASTGYDMTQHAIYLYLKLENWSKAEELSRAFLAKSNYSTEATDVVVNLEFSRKMQQKSISTSRIDEIKKMAKDDQVLAAVFSVLDKKSESLKHLKNALKIDKSFRFDALDWPVFKSLRSDPEFLDLVKLN
jgi:NAD-dependent SIR2 family protein deacetylase